MTRAGLAVAAAAAMLVVAGMFLGYPELVALGLAGFAAVTIALASLLIGGDVATTRVVDPVRAVEGGSTRSRVTVTNRGRVRTVPLVLTEILGRAAADVMLPGLAAGRQVEVIVELPTPDRGRFEMPPPVLWGADPFRLVGRRAGSGHSTVVWVHPRTRRLAPLPRPGIDDLDGTTSPHSAQGGAAFHSLREYREGDDWRLVHWASTARTGELVVRHDVVSDETHHVVVLDTRTARYPDDAAFDDAVRFAASWCVAATDAGCPVTVATTAGTTALHDVVDRSAAAPPPLALLDLLSDQRRSTGDGGLDRLPSTVASRRGTSVGIVTGRPDAVEVAGLAVLLRSTGALSMACVGLTPDRLPPAPRGVRVVAGVDLDAVADRWNLGTST